ncbi:hypothetical protein ACFOOP_14440 [Marinicaulis aureus]|uniref:Pentapeptide repeat-containing protein n=1 Tax=Hyphococcus aureus TaxID=2666033 RepID=A0ABW1KXW0_9PROT
MTNPIELRADCTRCAALCCMAPSFDKSPSFGFDKPPETPCSNLDGEGRCVIHADLASKGFPGCVAYDCHGAGQRVTQEIFGGRSWLAEPQLKPPMTRAFMVMRRIHELLSMLTAAQALPLDDGERQGLNALQNRLQPSNGWSEELLSTAPIDDLAAQIHAFLRSLKRHVSP